MVQPETNEERTVRKPRKKRISRALFRHDKIDFIKPKKQELLQKTFSFKFKKLVDKSKEIYAKSDEQTEDLEVDKNTDIIAKMDNTEKLTCPTSYSHKSFNSDETPLKNKHLILDMPSLDSPNPDVTITQVDDKTNKIERDKHPPVENNTEVSHRRTYEKDSSINNAQEHNRIQQINFISSLSNSVPRNYQIQNNSQNPSYAFYNVKNQNKEQKIDDQIPQYKITIVPDNTKSNGNHSLNIIPVGMKNKSKVKGSPEKYQNCQQNQSYYPYYPKNNHGFSSSTFPFFPPPRSQTKVLETAKVIWNQQKNILEPEKRIWNPHLYQANNQKQIDSDVNNSRKENLKYNQSNLEHKKLSISQINDIYQQKLESYRNKNLYPPNNFQNYSTLDNRNNPNNQQNLRHINQQINPNCTIVEERFTKNTNLKIQTNKYTVNHILLNHSKQNIQKVNSQLQANCTSQQNNSKQSSKIATKTKFVPKQTSSNGKMDLDCKIPPNIIIHKVQNLNPPIPVVQHISHGYQTIFPVQNSNYQNHAEIKSQNSTSSKSRQNCVERQYSLQKLNLFPQNLETRLQQNNAFSVQNKNIAQQGQKRSGEPTENIMSKRTCLESQSDKNSLLPLINYEENIPVITNKTPTIMSSVKNQGKTNDSVIIVNPIRQTNEQKVIVKNSDLHNQNKNMQTPVVNNNITQTCSVIKHTHNKNLHTIENILSRKCSVKQNTEINNNNSNLKNKKVNILKIEKVDLKCDFTNLSDLKQRSVIVQSQNISKIKSFECETIMKAPAKITKRRKTLLHINLELENSDETQIKDTISNETQKNHEISDKTCRNDENINESFKNDANNYETCKNDKNSDEFHKNHENSDKSKNDEKDKLEKRMPKLVKIPENVSKKNTNRHRTNNNPNNYASKVPFIRPAHSTVVSNRQNTIQPINLSLKKDTQMQQNKRQSIIVNNKQIVRDPLDLIKFTPVRDDKEYNEGLKLIKEKAHRPYLFYKFICDIRKMHNQSVFDLVTFFRLLKQGKLNEYKILYNQHYQ